MALGLYVDVLKYEIIETEVEYYADKEDAYDMAVFFDKTVRDDVIKEMREGYVKKKKEKEQAATESKSKPAVEEEKKQAGDGDTTSASES